MMKAVWQRIHAWLDASAPAGYGDLRPGASAKAIRAAENAMGLKLPDDVKASYRIHDGQGNEPGLIGGEGWRLLSLQEMVETWGRWSRADPKDAHCVPIAWIGTGDHVFLDLDPDSKVPGRLMIQRSDSADPDPLMPSFSFWLEDFADELEDGVFVYSEDDGEVMLADELDLD
jgi:cell wall assembly regulator SMI1